jgi:hypothetical protein
VTIYTGSMRQFFGDSFKPSDEESTNMTKALKVWLDTIGVNIPPWVAVALTFGVYTGSRFAFDPEARKRLVMLVNKVRGIAPPPEKSE